MRWAVCLIGVFCATATAQDANPAAKGKYADSVRFWRQRTWDVRDESASLIARMQEYADFVKDDLPHARTAYEAQAKAAEKIADLWEREDDKAAVAAQREYEKAVAISLVWQTRLWEWRRRQAEAAPSEQAYRNELSWTPQAVVPFLEDVIRCRKAAADAWGRLADATVPGADPNRLEALKDQAMAADARCEMALWKRTWASRREETWYDKTLASDALRAAFDQLDRLHERRLRLREAQIESDREARHADRQIQEMESQARRAYEAAKQARDNTGRN